MDEEDFDDDYREEIIEGRGALTPNKNKRPGWQDPDFSGTLVHGAQKIFISVWLDDGRLNMRSRDFQRKDERQKVRTDA